IVMMGNNETGVLQPLAEVAELAKQHGFLLMSDGVQAVGKIEVAVNEHSIDLMPISAHKMYGPQGVGALYIRSQGRKVDVAAQPTGRGCERGHRSGTLNVPAIGGLVKAAKIAQNQSGTE